MECQHKVDCIKQVFATLKIPIAVDKLEGPSQHIVFLGIKIDSVELTCRLPREKLCALSNTIDHWISLKMRQA